MAARVLLLSFVAIAACGGQTTRPSAHAPESMEIITTDDPAPYTPAPTETPQTGARSGGVVGGSMRQAIQVAQSFFDAWRTRDIETMRTLLGRTVLRSGQPRPSETEIMLRVSLAERSGFGPAASAGEFFDFGRATTASAAASYSGGMPGAYRGDDVVVTIPLRPLAFDMTADMTPPPHTMVRMIVRLRPEARILGY